ncbi:helix-turn-helix domain-containing protein [uncultured Clostridium sp.]|mgnify:CR=1 FL=1|jgi:transcriptional regulator with XRE-family HTH domain|uniref:helix-turn-helix domain-containing protein n=1 Tax=uncultured Clostridium sp. TaxID=59620 RepID=UPI00272ADFEF|nr:helix-turn-helix transcriptional regulator [uncultured Clostridium sp.]
MDFKSIGKKIADRRILLGKTQEEVAESLETSANYISNIETGIKSGSLIFYIKIANELNLSLDYLFSDELPKLSKETASHKEIIEMIDMLSKDEKQMANIFIRNIVKSLIDLRNEK